MHVFQLLAMWDIPEGRLAVAAIACGEAVELVAGCVLVGPGTMPCSLLSMMAVTALRISSSEGVPVTGMLLVAGAREVVVIAVVEVVAMSVTFSFTGDREETL